MNRIFKLIENNYPIPFFINYLNYLNIFFKFESVSIIFNIPIIATIIYIAANLKKTFSKIIYGKSKFRLIVLINTLILILMIKRSNYYSILIKWKLMLHTALTFITIIYYMYHNSYVFN